jgi:hypothetical protein
VVNKCVVSRPKKGQHADRPIGATAKKKGQRTGRPPIVDAAAKKDVPIHVLTTRAEREHLQRAADKARMSVSQFVRNAALEKADVLLAEPKSK